MNRDITLGIVALSLPSVGKRERLVRFALKYLQESGFNLKIGSAVFTQLSYKSASRQRRIRDLEQMYGDSSVDLILNTTGGYNSNELLEDLDWNLLRRNPKPFVGYSDLTTLNLALFKRGLSSINGPMLVDLWWDRGCLSRLFKTLTLPSWSLNCGGSIFEWGNAQRRKAPSLKRLPGKSKSTSGGLIAGNLSTFNLLIGTDYFPNLKNKVLFLEYDYDESLGLPSLERYLWQLRQNGILGQLKAFVFGTLPARVKREESAAWNLKKILSEVFEPFKYPVLYDGQFGHIYPSWILPNGAKVAIDGGRVKLELAKPLI